MYCRLLGTTNIQNFPYHPRKSIYLYHLWICSEFSFDVERFDRKCKPSDIRTENSVSPVSAGHLNYHIMLIHFNEISVNTRDCRRVALLGDEVQLSFQMNCDLYGGYDTFTMKFSSKRNADEVYKRVLKDFFKPITMSISEGSDAIGDAPRVIFNALN